MLSINYKFHMVLDRVVFIHTFEKIEIQGKYHKDFLQRAKVTFLKEGHA